MVGKHGVFVSFDHFDARLFECLANEHLKDGLYLLFVVKQIWIVVLDLDSLVCTLFVGDVLSLRGQVDVIVWLDLAFIDHVVAVIQLDPIVLGHHLDLLLLLLVHLHLLLLLNVCLIILRSCLHTIHLLLTKCSLLLLLSLFHFLQAITSRCSRLFLLFNR